MSLVETICADCGPSHTYYRAVNIVPIQHADNDVNFFYRCRCPHCRLIMVNPIGEDMVDQLTAGGVEIVPIVEFPEGELSDPIVRNTDPVDALVNYGIQLHKDLQVNDYLSRIALSELM